MRKQWKSPGCLNSLTALGVGLLLVSISSCGPESADPESSSSPPIPAAATSSSSASSDSTAPPTSEKGTADNRELSHNDLSLLTTAALQKRGLPATSRYVDGRPNGGSAALIVTLESLSGAEMSSCLVGLGGVADWMAEKGHALDEVTVLRGKAGNIEGWVFQAKALAAYNQGSISAEALVNGATKRQITP